MGGHLSLRGHPVLPFKNTTCSPLSSLPSAKPHLCLQGAADEAPKQDPRQIEGNTDPLPECNASFLHPIFLVPQPFLCFSSLTLSSSFTSFALSESFSEPAAEGPSPPSRQDFKWLLGTAKSFPSKRGSDGWELSCFVSEHELLSSEKLQELHKPEALNARVSRLSFPLYSHGQKAALPGQGHIIPVRGSW